MKGEIVGQQNGDASARMTGTYIDVTSRKQAEEALKDAKAKLARVMRISLLAEVTASIAHELKQPLCAIVANANACLRWLDGASAKADIRGALTALVEESHRASEIVSRTTDLFSNQNVESTPTDLNEAIRDVVHLTQPRWMQSSTVVEFALDPTLPPVSADPLQIRQVLLNLVANGLDAMRDVDQRQRRLRIQSRRGKHTAVVSVRDRGEGLGRLTAQDLFDPFYTTKPDGIGLGLTISRSIVEAHGGSIWGVANRHGGATFRFKLPLSA